MPKLSDVIELAAFSLMVTHELKDGTIVHKAVATYQFPSGTIDEPIEIDIEPAPAGLTYLEIVIVGAEIAPK